MSLSHRPRGFLPKQVQEENRCETVNPCKTPASLDHVCGTHCRRLCAKTLAIGSLSDNSKHFCFGVR